MPSEASTSLMVIGVEDSDAQSKLEEGQELAETINILLRRGSNLNAKDAYGRTPLHLVAARQIEAVTRLLLSKDGIDVNSMDARGCTPLLTAAQLGALVSIKVLLDQNDINVNCISDEDRSLFSYAVGYNIYNIEELISSLMVRNDVAIDGIDSYGRTPLSYACSYGTF